MPSINLCHPILSWLFAKAIPSGKVLMHISSSVILPRPFINCTIADVNTSGDPTFFSHSSNISAWRHRFLSLPISGHVRTCPQSLIAVVQHGQYGVRCEYCFWWERYVKTAAILNTCLQKKSERAWIPGVKKDWLLSSQLSQTDPDWESCVWRRVAMPHVDVQQT